MVAVLTFTAFAGCGAGKEENAKAPEAANGQTGTGGKPVELVLWGGIPADKGPDAMVENYNKRMDGKVTLKYNRYVTGDGDTAVDIALMSGEHIDAFLSHDFDKMSGRINKGITEDLSGLMKKYDFDMTENFGAATKPFQQQDGKVFAIPTTLMNFFVLLNKDALDAEKLPVPTDWTLDEMADYAKKLTKGEGANKVFGFFTPRPDLPVILAGTALDYQFYYNKDITGTNWDKPEFRKALEISHKMTNIDKSIPSYVDALTQKLAEADYFPSGKCAMALGLSYVLRNVKDLEKFPHTFVTAFAPLPKVSGDQSKYYTDQLLNDFFSINAKSQYKAEAFEFYKWFATEGYIPLIQHGRIPLYQKFDKDSIIKELVGDNEKLFDTESMKSVLLAEAKDPQTIKSYTANAQIFKIYTENYEKFITGNMNADAMISDLDKRTTQAIKDAK